MCHLILQQKENYVIAVVSGDMVLTCSHELKEKLKIYLKETDCNRVIVDLSGVDFMDSSGLGVLIAWFKFVSEEKGNIIFTSPTAYVAKLIDLAKLNKVLLFSETLTDAENSFMQV